MSTTAQETLADAAGNPTTNPNVDAGAQTGQTPAPAETATQRSSADVEYLIFEEARTDTWTQLGKQRAKTAELAIETLVGEPKLKTAQGRFMAVPTRYITQKKPKVTTVTSIDWD